MWRCSAGLLAVGLQAQLQDAEGSAGEAGAEGGKVRARGARLVRDCAAVFGLTADDLLDGGVRSQVGFQQACLQQEL